MALKSGLSLNISNALELTFKNVTVTAVYTPCSFKQLFPTVFAFFFSTATSNKSKSKSKKTLFQVGQSETI